MGSAAISLGGPRPVSEQSAATSVASAQPAAAVDKVSLTGDGVRMQQLSKAAAAGPDIDTGRVAAAKAAIANGSYQVNAQSVASKLTRFEWDMQ